MRVFQTILALLYFPQQVFQIIGEIYLYFHIFILYWILIFISTVGWFLLIYRIYYYCPVFIAILLNSLITYSGFLVNGIICLLDVMRLSVNKTFPPLDPDPDAFFPSYFLTFKNTIRISVMIVVFILFLILNELHSFLNH